MTTTALPPARAVATGAGTIAVSVIARTTEADDVVRLVLAATDGSNLPAWEPGAHVDVLLPTGEIRQYSLCGELGARDVYEIGVLREPAGRGGSVEIHDAVHEGSILQIWEPRNHFACRPASDYLFIAGGIGITPILPMIDFAQRSGASWHLVYGGRSRASMAFTARLGRTSGNTVDLLPQDEYGHLDLAGILGRSPKGQQIYSCGPAALLDALQDVCQSMGRSADLHIERFTAGAAAPRPADGDQPFEVELAQSGITLQIGADESLIDVVQDAAPDVLFSCGEGYCGTCQVRVIEGVPDHRDTVMMPEEHDAEQSMIMCVGRSKTPRLVLDA